MNILVATSEAVPFAKTGGLADVCGALPVELARLGHSTTLILPAYRKTQYCGLPIEPMGIDFIVPIGSKTVTGHLLRTSLPCGNNSGVEVPVFLVKQDSYFDRDELYSTQGKDYIDNCERFVFFSRAVLEAIRLLDLPVDIIQANDWQTGLVPAYLKLEYRAIPRYENIATVFTIHNLAYQGQFWHWDMLLTGLDWKYFNWQQMEFHGKLNLLKTGLVFADAVSTVSPRYAREIQHSPLGCGLEGTLQQRRDVLSGILNGCDGHQWNPISDPHLPVNYDADSFEDGKATCKAALQEELGLPQQPDVPLVGFIGRLCDQKGIDLVAEMMQQWVQDTDLQWAILGTGEPHYHEFFESLSAKFPTKVAARLEFANPLAHRIEAGADIFLMPSRYEPCGLNQLYSLRYGTVPVTRATGGLADTITDANDQTLADGTANGFSFEEYSTAALSETFRRACGAYRHPEQWKELIAIGMRQDWSWARSALRYVELFGQTVARARGSVYV